MITVWIWNMMDTIKYAFFSAIPTFSTPAWVAENLPGILRTVMSFNYYLPVLDTLTIVLILINATLAWKVLKVFLSLFVDLGA